MAEVYAGAGDVGAVNDAGVQLLASGFARVGAACTRAGHSRFEEGSEHFFAYALEARTKRTYIHGELIAFATLVMAVVQDNHPERAADAIARSQVRARPEHLGISTSLFVDVMVGLRDYARQQNLWWSVIDDVDVAADTAQSVWSDVRRMLRVP